MTTRPAPQRRPAGEQRANRASGEPTTLTRPVMGGPRTRRPAARGAHPTGALTGAVLAAGILVVLLAVGWSGLWVQSPTGRAGGRCGYGGAAGARPGSGSSSGCVVGDSLRGRFRRRCARRLRSLIPGGRRAWRPGDVASTRWHRAARAGRCGHDSFAPVGRPFSRALRAPPLGGRRRLGACGRGRQSSDGVHSSPSLQQQRDSPTGGHWCHRTVSSPSASPRSSRR